MKPVNRRTIVLPLLLVAAAGLGWALFRQFQTPGAAGNKGARKQPAPVEVGPILRGPIELRRTYSGTLEARAEFVVAPKVSGRVERLTVNLADTVKRDQVVAELDNDEYVQEVAQAKADLEVARANLSEAKSALEIADRDLERIRTLRGRGVASESQLDAGRANHLTKQAQVEVAKAQVTKAESSLETANIRLRYTKVRASWTGGSDNRVVAERFANEGGTVSANAPLLLIVELDPITGVMSVTEKDYVRMRTGQIGTLTTDAYPGETFEGRIDRIAPVFRQATRQARVELTIRNAEHKLKPGMFIRVTVVLDRMAEATIVPEKALTTRDNRTGVFVVSEDGKSVSWRDVTVGIRDGDRVQVDGKGLSGRVVTLGQQLVDDGSPITIPATESKSPSADPKAAGK
ncbi:MAG: efflux RND transporter periplasmic adaptor subunit [Thermodesulfobacteriota bacterium]|nr:efflux RND transporter periplasmic adaptor subunit [Thermodesulfobacteriota bacterium]